MPAILSINMQTGFSVSCLSQSHLRIYRPLELTEDIYRTSKFWTAITVDRVSNCPTLGGKPSKLDLSSKWSELYAKAIVCLVSSFAGISWEQRASRLNKVSMLSSFYSISTMLQCLVTRRRMAYVSRRRPHMQVFIICPSILILRFYKTSQAHF